MQYQTNIDNYRLALDLLAQKPDPDMTQFAQTLQGLLVSEITEQKKAQIMLDVALTQLAGQDIQALLKEAENVPT